MLSYRSTWEFVRTLEKYGEALRSLSLYLSFISFHFSLTTVVALQAGNFVRDDAVPSLIVMLSNKSDLQAYAVQSLFKAVRDDISQVSTL